MKVNRNKKICKREVRFLLENMDEFIIPMTYIKRIKKDNGYINEIVVSKEYLKVLDKYHMFYNYYKTLESSILRFKTALDITSIEIGNKWHNVHYIEPTNSGLGENNILQSIEETDNTIIFRWNTYAGNKFIFTESCEWYDVGVQVEEKYKNIIFDYAIVKFIPNSLKE